MTRITCFMILLAILPAMAQQPTSLEVEAGYQNVEIDDGLFPLSSENAFRSQYDLDDGILVRNLRYILSGGDSPGFLDQFSIEAGGFGALPDGFLRLRADKAKIFTLRLNYRQFDHFNALTGAHTVDRTRRTMDMTLTFLPRGKWRPFVGYRWNSYDGPALTTIHLGQDEFFLSSDLDEEETELHLGLRYEGSKVQAELMQGWRSFEGTETFSGRGTGNSRPVLGEDIVLDSYDSVVDHEADTPVTSAMVRVTPHRKVRVLGTYVMADAESETRQNELFTGRFASFRIARFFNGGNASVRAETESPSYRGNLRLETSPGGGVDVGLGYSKRNLELDGDAMMETLYLDSVTFSNRDQRDYLELMDAVSFMERDEESLVVDLEAKLPHGFALKAAYSSTDEEVTVDQSLAEIVTPGGQEGTFDRSLDRLSLSAAWRKDNHRVQAEWRGEDADNAVVRTDFLDRTTLALRARTGWKDKLLITGVLRRIESENDNPDIALDQDLQHLGIDAEIMPHYKLTLRLNYGLFDFESEVQFVAPDFITEQSQYREDSESLGFELDLTLKKLELRAAYSGYDSDGVNAWPSTLDNTRLELGFHFLSNLTLRLEAARYSYENSLEPLIDYDADVYGLLIHWRR